MFLTADAGFEFYDWSLIPSMLQMADVSLRQVVYCVPLHHSLEGGLSYMLAMRY